MTIALQVAETYLKTKPIHGGSMCSCSGCAGTLAEAVNKHTGPIEKLVEELQQQKSDLIVKLAEQEAAINDLKKELDDANKACAMMQIKLSEACNELETHRRTVAEEVIFEPVA